MRWNTIRLTDEGGGLFNIVAWLPTLPRESETHAITVWAQSGKHQAALRTHLVVRRKTPQAIEAAHKHLFRQGSRKQTKPDPRSQVAAEYLILATSLPAADFRGREVLAVDRLRWQLELAFNRPKSRAKLGTIRIRTEAGTRCWLYARLIVALLCDNLSQELL